jgi:hypothetical protein
MAEQATNQIDSDLFNGMSTNSEIQSAPEASISPSHAFVAKTIHPPSAVGNYEGIPTNDTRSQVLLNWTGFDLTNPPLGGYVTGVRPPAIFPSEWAFLVPNGGRIKYITFFKDVTSGIWYQDLANVGIVDTYDWDNWFYDANKYRQAYRSTTICLNATMFNNVGMVSSCQFNPAVLFTGTILTLAEKDPALFMRHMRAQMTAKKINILSRTHAEYDDKLTHWLRLPKHIRLDLAEVFGLKDTDALELDPNTLFQLINFGNSGEDTLNSDFVPTLSQVLQSSQRSMGGKAMEGTFTVQRMNTVAPKWYVANTTKAGGGYPNLKGLYQCNTYWIDNLNIPHVVSFFENAPTGTLLPALVPLCDTEWGDDWTWSWTHFKGMVPNNVLTGDLTVASELFSLKTYLGLEVQPANKSAWSGMMRLSPKPDLTAMQALMDAFYELKDTFPARYNFWGTLGTIAASGLKTLGSSLLKELVGGDKTKKAKTKSAAPARRQQTSAPVSTRQRQRPHFAAARRRDVRNLNRDMQQLNVDARPRQRQQRRAAPVARSAPQAPRQRPRQQRPRRALPQASAPPMPLSA